MIPYSLKIPYSINLTTLIKAPYYHIDFGNGGMLPSVVLPFLHVVPYFEKKNVSYP
jgi:hypothetical protein